MAATKSKGNTSDIYLALLKLGNEKSLEGVTDDDVLQLGVKQGYLTNNEAQVIGHFGDYMPDQNPETMRKQRALWNLYNESFGPPVLNRRVLNVDGYFKLLEHEELVLARENAQSAKMFSTWAIIIALISLIVSAYQAGNPIALTDSQYQGITNTESVEAVAERIDALNGKLDSLIKATEVVKPKPAK